MRDIIGEMGWGMMGGGMFRRRTSSSGKIHYRINIDKSMCPNPVDIY